MYLVFCRTTLLEYMQLKYQILMGQLIKHSVYFAFFLCLFVSISNYSVTLNSGFPFPESLQHLVRVTKVCTSRWTIRCTEMGREFTVSDLIISVSVYLSFFTTDLKIPLIFQKYFFSRLTLSSFLWVFGVQGSTMKLFQHFYVLLNKKILAPTPTFQNIQF